MTLDPRAVTTDSVPLSGDATRLPARGFPWPGSVHIDPKSSARGGLGVRKGHPRPWDSTGPGPESSRHLPARNGDFLHLRPRLMPSNCWRPGAGSPLPSALTSDHLGHQTGPRALPAHGSRASGRRGGGREGPEGQGTTGRRGRRSCGHTPEV